MTYYFSLTRSGLLFAQKEIMVLTWVTIGRSVGQ